MSQKILKRNLRFKTKPYSVILMLWRLKMPENFSNSCHLDWFWGIYLLRGKIVDDCLGFGLREAETATEMSWTLARAGAWRETSCCFDFGEKKGHVHAQQTKMELSPEELCETAEFISTSRTQLTCTICKDLLDTPMMYGNCSWKDSILGKRKCVFLTWGVLQSSPPLSFSSVVLVTALVVDFSLLFFFWFGACTG